MSKPIFVDWCPKDVLDGVQTLEPLEELAYRRILDLIYVTGDNLPDDDKRLAWMTKVGRKWTAIKGTLVEMGKIEIIDGRISNHRCRETLQKTAQKIDQKREAGIASAEKRKSQKNNDNRLAGVGTDVGTGVPTTQEPKNPRDTTAAFSADECADAVPPEGAAPPSPRIVVGAKVLALMGLTISDPKWFGDTRRVDAWLASGADPEADIYPTVSRLMDARRRTEPGWLPNSLNYFDRAIADAVRQRTKPLPEGQNHAPNTRSVPTNRGRATTAERRRIIAEAFADQLGSDR